MSPHNEPAILYIILCELQQNDPLIIQRVSRFWRATVTGDNRLLSMLWFRPTRSDYRCCAAAFQPSSPAPLPLFREIGMTIEECDKYSLVEDMPRRAANLDSEASWRKMIPCRPSPIKLQFDIPKPGPVIGHGSGTLRCLTPCSESTHDNACRSLLVHDN